MSVPPDRGATEPTRRVLTARAIRIAAIAPVLVVGATLLVLGETAAPRPLLAVLVVVAALMLLGLRTEWLRRLEAEPAPTLPALVGALGVLAGVVVLPTAAGLDPRALTISFGVVVVAAAFVLPGRQRTPLIAWSLLGWALTLVLDGQASGLEIVTQLGGAVALAAVSLLCTSTLEEALRVEREASRLSRTRASLLGSVLRLQALEPTAVADAVVRGVREAGFDLTTLRVLDGPDLRLVAARPRPGEDPPMRLGPGQGIASVVRRTGKPMVVSDLTEHPARLEDVPDLRGAIATPITIDGAPSGVLFAARHERGLTPLQLQAIELLAEEAGHALGRARRFAADASTVAELRRLDERTHDFVSTVSHELRTPMTVIDGLGQTLRRRWDDLTPERRADLLRRIDENAARLAEMVRSLVDSSALDRGQLVARPAPVDLRGCVSAVFDRLGSMLEEHEVHLEVAEGLIVEADPSLLEHVVENLLVNAARHTPPGTEVLVRGTRRGDEVEVEVADAGPGIAPEDLPHILERFYRAGEPTTRTSGGLGLGLALSQQILQAHGRELTVRSRVEVGTSFRFELPMAAPGDEPSGAVGGR